MDEAVVKYRRRIYLLLEKYEPEKVGGAVALSQKAAGREEPFMKALVKKYGPEPPYVPLPPNYIETLRSRLTAFYTQNDPSKLSTIPTLIQNYAGADEGIFRSLEKNYNVAVDRKSGLVEAGKTPPQYQSSPTTAAPPSAASPTSKVPIGGGATSAPVSTPSGKVAIGGGGGSVAPPTTKPAPAAGGGKRAPPTTVPTPPTSIPSKKAAIPSPEAGAPETGGGGGAKKIPPPVGAAGKKASIPIPDGAPTPPDPVAATQDKPGSTKTAPPDTADATPHAASPTRRVEIREPEGAAQRVSSGIIGASPSKSGSASRTASGAVGKTSSERRHRSKDKDKNGEHDDSGKASRTASGAAGRTASERKHRSKDTEQTDDERRKEKQEKKEKRRAKRDAGDRWAGYGSLDEQGQKDHMRDRLRKFYNRYDVAKMGGVDGIVDKYFKHPAKLFAVLEKKYGPEPHDDDVSSDDGEKTPQSPYPQRGGRPAEPKTPTTPPPESDGLSPTLIDSQCPSPVAGATPQIQHGDIPHGSNKKNTNKKKNDDKTKPGILLGETLEDEVDQDTKHPSTTATAPPSKAASPAAALGGPRDFKKSGGRLSVVSDPPLHKGTKERVPWMSQLPPPADTTTNTLSSTSRDGRGGFVIVLTEEKAPLPPTLPSLVTVVNAVKVYCGKSPASQASSRGAQAKMALDIITEIHGWLNMTNIHRVLELVRGKYGERLSELLQNLPRQQQISSLSVEDLGGGMSGGGFDDVDNLDGGDEEELVYELQARVGAFFSRFDPGLVSLSVPIGKVYFNYPDDILAALEARYANEIAGVRAQEMAEDQFRHRIKKFLNYHHPKHQYDIGLVRDIFSEKEAVLMQYLEREYGPEPKPSYPNPPTKTHAAARRKKMQVMPPHASKEGMVSEVINTFRILKLLQDYAISGGNTSSSDTAPSSATSSNTVALSPISSRLKGSILTLKPSMWLMDLTNGVSTSTTTTGGGHVATTSQVMRCVMTNLLDDYDTAHRLLQFFNYNIALAVEYLTYAVGPELLQGALDEAYEVLRAQTSVLLRKKQIERRQQQQSDLQNNGDDVEDEQEVLREVFERRGYESSDPVFVLESNGLDRFTYLMIELFYDEAPCEEDDAIHTNNLSLAGSPTETSICATSKHQHHEDPSGGDVAAIHNFLCERGASHRVNESGNILRDHGGNLQASLAFLGELYPPATTSATAHHGGSSSANNKYLSVSGAVGRRSSNRSTNNNSNMDNSFNNNSSLFLNPALSALQQVPLRKVIAVALSEEEVSERNLIVFSEYFEASSLRQKIRQEEALFQRLRHVSASYLVGGDGVGGSHMPLVESFYT